VWGLRALLSIAALHVRVFLSRCVCLGLCARDSVWLVASTWRTELAPLRLWGQLPCICVENTHTNTHTHTLVYHDCHCAHGGFQMALSSFHAPFPPSRHTTVATHLLVACGACPSLPVHDPCGLLAGVCGLGLRLGLTQPMLVCWHACPQASSIHSTVDCTVTTVARRRIRAPSPCVSLFVEPWVVA
jgi:hypothetical protein